jgi:hypothetical protein
MNDECSSNVRDFGESGIVVTNSTQNWTTIKNKLIAAVDQHSKTPGMGITMLLPGGEALVVREPAMLRLPITFALDFRGQLQSER